MNTILISVTIFLVTSVIALIGKCFSKRYTKHRQEHADIKVIETALVDIQAFMKKHSEEHKCLEKNDVQLKENAMFHTREVVVKFYYKGKAQGHLDKYELKLVEELYKNYISLGGNSFVTDLMTEIRNGTYNL